MQTVPSEFQDQLVRGLAHRMNNILSLFHGYLGLMLDDKKLDKTTLDGLAKIKDSARAASELMDRTHALVRPAAVVWREVQLRDFIRMLRPSFDAIRGPKTELAIYAPDELPCVWGDATRIKTVIMEIVRNALEATAAGGNVTITLHANPHSSGNSARQTIHWVVVDVIDTGPGISEPNRERVFDPFFSTRRKRNATGLGLTVALGFIQQLGGALRCESQPGHTHFQILFPARTAGL